MASSEGGGGRGEGVVGRGGRSRQVVLRVEMHWRQRLSVAHLVWRWIVILATMMVTQSMTMMIYDDNFSLNEDLTEGLYRAEGRREAGAIRGALPSRQSR